jgi:REP element-mobilizing transposase RayT
MSFRKSSISSGESHDGDHRFEHWYRDNTVYFLTARCRGKTPAFLSEEAKAIFWDRLLHYAMEYGFALWVVSLLDNHYHIVGYLKHGESLGPFVRHLHGSVAKLVNDLLPIRLKPFWYDTGKQGYWDGCLRDEQQGRKSFRYTLLQAVEAGIVKGYRDYPHTRVFIELERAIRRATELKVWLEDVPYKRYEK